MNAPSEVVQIGVCEPWAGRIGAAFQKSVDAIFETGRLIAEAKAALPHGAFQKMVDTDLPFGRQTAYKLMAIASDEKLSNVAHGQHLPSSWTTLYELTKLDADTFKRRIADKSIRPDMQRRDVATGGARSIMASREQSKASLDYFPTPPWATRALINDVLANLGIDPSIMGVVCDPACGEGHMSGVLLEYLSDVRAFDIGDYSRDGRDPPAWLGQRDFLNSETMADWFVTNPPFGEVTLPFVQAALARAHCGVAMFVRQQWLEGGERYVELFSKQPPTLYAQFAERVNLCEGRWEPFGSTATAYCWLVWVKDMAPQPPFWIPPGRKVAYFKADDIARFTAHPVLPPKCAPPGPFRSTPQTDALIIAGYAAETFDRLAIAKSIGATRLQVARRANQLGLGSRDRQRSAASAVMTKLNQTWAGQSA